MIDLINEGEAIFGDEAISNPQLAADYLATFPVSGYSAAREQICLEDFG